MNFRMKFKTTLLLAAAASLCCISCVEQNLKIGGNLVPVGQTYNIYNVDIPITEIYNMMADSLSGFSNSRITIGSVRDSEYGLTTRGSAFTLIPFAEKEGFDMGTNRVFKSFHFAASRDTVNFNDPSQKNILQNVYVYELSKALDAKVDFDCNKPVLHSDKRITRGTPVYDGKDSLSFDFNSEFGRKYLEMTAEDMTDIKTYLKKFPGIYIETGKPIGEGGRINMFNLQLNYSSNLACVLGNYATLCYSAEFNGVRKDTTMHFWYGTADLFDLDSLFSTTGTGNFPQYALNVTGHTTRERAGKATDKIFIEGGGGLKPMIPAKYLKKLAEDEIIKSGGRPDNVVINKATLVFPFEFPADYKEVDDFWPDVLSPTCKIRIDDKRVTFMGLTDSSSSTENQGDINRSRFIFAPDITYHLQELLKIDESKPDSEKMKKLNRGEYDIWLLIMHNEIITTTTEGDSDMSEYYNYLAYQSYYNSMYGGYGGYGGYGYGGYNDYYTNYYSYMMMAQYAGQSQTSQSVSVQLDKDRYY